MTVKKRRMVLFIVCALFSSLFAWGRDGHRIINVQAVRLMPAPVDSFFKAFSDSLGILGDAPDEWKKENASQKYLHYIDLDLLDVYPFKRIPHVYKDAESRFGKPALEKAGTLPWTIERYYRSLVADFPRGNWPSLRDDLLGLAHFIGDAHQPLHSTTDYNGQKHGNKGIHFRYEIDLMDRFPEKYRLLPKAYLARPKGKIASPVDTAFGFMLQGFVQVDRLNNADIECKSDRAEYDAMYYVCFDNKIGPAQRRQMALAAAQVAAFWYSAWLEAGQPHLKCK